MEKQKKPFQSQDLIYLVILLTVPRTILMISVWRI